MSAHAELDEPVGVALIGRADEARAQLQAALTEFGAEVVFEGEPTDIDLAALQGAAPGVVIVNLDPAVEDALDHLQAVLDDPDVNVIFNEAEVTRQLGGWDLARWARHLAAKVLGHQDTNPPPPPGAERLPTSSYMPVPGAPPTPAQMAGERFIEEFTVEADDHADAIPTDYMPMEVGYTAQASAAHDDGFAVDLDAIEGALAHSEARPEVAATAVPDAPTVAGDDVPMEFDLDLSALDAALSAPAAPARAAPTDEAALLDAALDGLNLDLDPDAEAPASAADAPVGHSQFAGDDAEFVLDEDIAALAAQLDGIASTTQPEHGEEIGTYDPVPMTESAEDEAAPVGAGQAGSGAAASVAQAASFDFGALELAPMEDDAPAQAPSPRAQQAPSSFDFDALNLSLEPIEGESPQDAGAEADAPGQAIRRVVVLGASIGGPDALRTFLAGIPRDFPALFVLAQHLDNGFFERLAQQLQKSSNIPVRVAQPGEPARHGEVLVVPSDQRVAVEPDGTIACEPHGEAPRYRPCIDDVMRDIADRFGARATAIVFSGMAGDGIDGSVYVTAKGGEVWAQCPESCVVSSMVDGASARGVVEFTGTPRELAERCVARYGQQKAAMDDGVQA